MDRIDGICVPQILLPNEKVNMKKWAVVACDQFAGNVQYWTEVERFVGMQPSTLSMMLPEAYLSYADVTVRIESARQTMEQYLSNGVLEQLPAGFILVERELRGSVRHGLMVAIDLEEYDYRKDTRPLVRASEKTILERVAARAEIRRGALLEMPHVLVLINDIQQTVIEPLFESLSAFQKVYDTELMMGGGSVRGYFVPQGKYTQEALTALEALPLFDGMRFCVGDGNHSLATAKLIYEELKGELGPEAAMKSPLRYALVEMINIHDPGLTFQPIHRVLRGVNAMSCVQELTDRLNLRGAKAKLIFSNQRGRITPETEGQAIGFRSKEGRGRIEFGAPLHQLPGETIDCIIEEYAAAQITPTIEYIHGDEEFTRLTDEYDTLGFYLPAMEKATFFETVVACGVLPKKSFSLGEAEEKRYYLECRGLFDPSDDGEKQEGRS